MPGVAHNPNTLANHRFSKPYLTEPTGVDNRGSVSETRKLRERKHKVNYTSHNSGPFPEGPPSQESTFELLIDTLNHEDCTAEELGRLDDFAVRIVMEPKREKRNKSSNMKFTGTLCFSNSSALEISREMARLSNWPLEIWQESIASLCTKELLDSPGSVNVLTK
ncbi:hypothetical protein FRB95_010440 [Tulasnella sp. JGI-2019a]|nr:hypothetical protein FRB93_004589 [Tulasnella sp. JGI-2019a]KAG9035846.1 hypothetical protein FRB95_010440 [Tulasnella sp. JGI-2019a]